MDLLEECFGVMLQDGLRKSRRIERCGAYDRCEALPNPPCLQLKGQCANVLLCLANLRAKGTIPRALIRLYSQ